MRRAATDVLGERGHVLEPPADLLAVQVDAGATDGHQLKLMLRRRHAGRPLPDRRRPSPAMNVKYILFLHSKQYTFHFRARLAAGLGAARDGGFWLAAKAYEMTSAWEIGSAQVCTPVTNAHLVCRLLLEKKKYN